MSQALSSVLRQEAGNIGQLADTCNGGELMAAGHLRAFVKAEPQAGCISMAAAGAGRRAVSTISPA